MQTIYFNVYSYVAKLDVFDPPPRDPSLMNGTFEEEISLELTVRINL